MKSSKKLKNVFPIAKIQLRLQDNAFDSSNPYSAEFARGNNQDFSSAFRNKAQSIQQAPSKWDENYEPSQRQYNDGTISNRNNPDLRKGDNDRNIQNYAPGSLWDSVGEDHRKKALLNDYKSYMKNNPLPAYTKQRQGNEYNQREEPSLLARKQSSDPIGGGWYTQNSGIGILPGMDEKPGSRRNQEFRPLQDKYTGNESSSKIGYTPSGSRLAGIGSRLLDNPRDYASVDSRRGGLDDVQNYRTPQLGADRDRIGLKFGLHEYSSLQLGRLQSFSNDKQGGNSDFEKKFESLNNLDTFKGSYGQEVIPKPSFHVKPKQEFNFSFANKISGDLQGQDQGRQVARETGVKRSEEPSSKGTYGGDWVNERFKQEEDRKLKQKDELQRIYREQIEEKKRKKQEEQKRQLLEDQKEEERLRRENEELQRQYMLEQNKKKGLEEPKASNPQKYSNEEANMNYKVGGRSKSEKPQTNIFEASAQTNYRREIMQIPRPVDYQLDDKDDPEIQRIEAIIKEASSKFSNPVISRPKYERPEKELPVHKGITQYNSALDDQLDKMKKDISHHAHLIKTELSGYRKQAFDSLELRQNAQNELLMLREELKAQQLNAGNSTAAEEFGFTSEKGTGFKLAQARSQDRIGLRIPNKNYSKIYAPEEEGQDLGVAPSTSLNVETNYISAKGGNQRFKELPKVEEMLHKFGNDRDNSAAKVSNQDAAMQKFSMLFPSHNTKGQGNENFGNVENDRGYGNTERMEYDEDQDLGNRRVNSYETLQRGGDEVQGMSSFVTRGNGNTRFNQDEEGDYELPASQELVGQ